MSEQGLKQLENVKLFTWTKRWAGSYTFISCSNYGWEYFNSMNKVFGSGFSATVHIHKKGTVSCYLPKEELERIANLADLKIQNNSQAGVKWLENVITLTDKLLPKMRELSNRIPTWEEYREFQNYYDEYLPHHVFMKELIDFLPVDLVKSLENKFAEAREYSTPVYSESEKFFRNLALMISVKTGEDSDLLICLSRLELKKYLKTQELPNPETLKSRYSLSAIAYENNQESIILNEDAEQIENTIQPLQVKDNRQIKGMTGFRGKVEGVCRVILDPFNYRTFNDGEILVTGMTRPEFIPIMKKASAFVTDAGGMLCHAAITAREMKKPCVIGTEVATKILKDGDFVEVDADNGTVRKI